MRYAPHMVITENMKTKIEGQVFRQSEATRSGIAVVLILWPEIRATKLDQLPSQWVISGG